MQEQRTKFDIAVVGGGPAGIMAAGQAAELGAKVLLLEKNSRAGRKILITGKGRSNITHAEFDLRKLVAEYGKNGPFLFHAFSVFGVKDVIKFFEDRGLKTKVERGKRIFPVSDNAQDVVDVLVNYLKNNDVKIMYNSEVKNFEKKNNRIEKIILKNGKEIIADNYIICTGGKSYPATGSTGDGYKFAKDLGHKIVEPRPALVPIKMELLRPSEGGVSLRASSFSGSIPDDRTSGYSAAKRKENWAKELQGLSLKNVEITVLQNNKKQTARFGECLFTHFGLSGPIILDISKTVGELLKKGIVKLSLDLKPALGFSNLDVRLQRDFRKYQKKNFKNCLDDLLPKKLIPFVIKLSGIDPEKKAGDITREERYKLVKSLKNIEMEVVSLLGFDCAIVTSGGVSLDEIDHKTMKSKIIDNLYFAGEVIDVDGPTGGYNLQMCWSTGFLAGERTARRFN
ncbi:MAG: aminoacetone oxidase family FAD-binding enzyme [Candidatus Nealsonbacteria bacterium CG_4_10_14_0_2_um_filter_38_17]|uniref:Aminoacetone oxidase family FAD-binding enzyme n=2 Tax=Candidatus Nealsoniibacteriota TaxID=1817911 RepID=A0A2M7UX60_9BACT|nr:MAG: aminoacetone oxidase family FAD-binding enzyme [Candidatus Nealsonbacteria bacterium CG23_combo_of_CG06-09_8_20_14_all_38_19]PIZ88552.1 MAG: aminoacetone oxidase family FAD-binding enzyme [Candidatus Nealsonbacteria bacterium CG_4_10_14_0_2_um_filter_38_17]